DQTRVSAVIDFETLRIRLERKFLARVVAESESDHDVRRTHREWSAARLAIVHRLRIPAAPPIRVPIVLPRNRPVAEAAVGDLVAPVIPVLVFAEPPIDVARVFRSVFVDVRNCGVRRRLVGPRHESEVVYFESRRERLDLKIRTPPAGLLAEHRASAESAERSSRRIVMNIIGIRTSKVVR